MILLIRLHHLFSILKCILIVLAIFFFWAVCFCSRTAILFLWKPSFSFWKMVKNFAGGGWHVMPPNSFELTFSACRYGMSTQTPPSWRYVGLTCNRWCKHWRGEDKLDFPLFFEFRYRWRAFSDYSETTCFGVETCDVSNNASNVWTHRPVCNTVLHSYPLTENGSCAFTPF